MSEKHSFPVQGKQCQNPICIRKRKIEDERLDKYREKAESLLEKFLDQEHAYAYFRVSNHVRKRGLERAFSESKLFFVIEETGYVISCSSEDTFTVMGREKIGKGQYRIYHIPLTIKYMNGRYNAFVFTAYDPAASSHLYDPSYERRHCWCQPHYIDE